MRSYVTSRKPATSADAAAATSSTSPSSWASPGMTLPRRQINAPDPANSAAVRAIIARMAGASTPFSDAFRQRSRSRRGASMLLLWLIASPSKPGVTIWPVSLSRQNASRVDPAADRAWRAPARLSPRDLRDRGRGAGARLDVQGRRDGLHAAHLRLADDQRERLSGRAPRLRGVVRPRRPRRRRLLRAHARGAR